MLVNNFVRMIKLQKKICLIILSYIIILLIVGSSYYVHRQMQKFPVLEKAVLEEIIKTVDEKDLLKEEQGEDKSSESAGINQDDHNTDYWGNYHNGDKQGNLTSEDLLSRLKDVKVSSADKLKVYYIIYKNLGKEDINYIISLSKNGLTTDEKEQIKALLQQKLALEAKQELKSLIMKYINEI